MDTRYTFWDNITHYKTESVHFGGLKNSATKARALVSIYISATHRDSRREAHFPLVSLGNIFVHINLLAVNSIFQLLGLLQGSRF